MSTAIKSVLAVWLVLMLSTAASTWWFSQPMFAPMVSTVAVMLIAATKVGLVMSHFMELRGAPRPWQLAGAIWVLAALSVVMFIYLL
ncbi:MAG: cytochrome C oxidase subunit IV family protein [Panacagrimonas sp.]